MVIYIFAAMIRINSDFARLQRQNFGFALLHQPFRRGGGAADAYGSGCF